MEGRLTASCAARRHDIVIHNPLKRSPAFGARKIKVTNANSMKACRFKYHA